MANEDLARFIDRFTVEYVRTYPHPIERVWKAITDPAEFGRWFIRGRLDLKQGGEYWFGDDGFTGKVAELDPPRFIRFAGPKDDRGFFQYQLEPMPTGTRMRFIQHFAPDGVYTEVGDDLGGDVPVPGTPWKPGFVGGWHEFWDALGDYLEDVRPGSRLPDTAFTRLADDWVDKLERGGLYTAAQAARAKLSLRRHERWDELNKIYREHIRLTVPAKGE